MILTRSILLVSFILSGLLYSQTNVTIVLPVVTLMDIEPAGNITLSFTAPTEAGNALGNPTPNTSKWINYTSAITSGGLTRRITAAVNQTIPGVNIRLQAAAASGSGGGTLGTAAAQITLSTTPTTIISGIGGAYTGNGTNNGHRLTISLVPGTYANLSAQTNTAVTIVYTITE
ncbi:hypothetical protein F3J23_21260 [Chryseobacterium sp. Tr-659]|uniref:hypothetical protein n=1 Tax=Chryseobacterium sp. Tr-659 TaxID=2608340 RepID=UPI00141F361A|nr:hypothetical protein [Chryseobacterium sp. Tr-659]NIF07960.1 hypothetical protein [Chryseobacterium sp. Tr-659]